jgi:hypothetical protein
VGQFRHCHVLEGPVAGVLVERARLVGDIKGSCGWEFPGLVEITCYKYKKSEGYSRSVRKTFTPANFKLS